MISIIYQHLKSLFNKIQFINKMNKQNLILETFNTLTYNEQLDIYYQIQVLIKKNETPIYKCLLTEKEIYELSWF